MMDAPRFDTFETCGNAEWACTVVVHRDTTGAVFALHSPLTDGPVRCDLCTTPGTRVYMAVVE